MSVKGAGVSHDHRAGRGPTGRVPRRRAGIRRQRFARGRLRKVLCLSRCARACRTACRCVFASDIDASSPLFRPDLRFCAPCDANWYKPGNDSVDAIGYCEACETEASADPGSAWCDCVAGWAGLNGFGCAQCSPGKYTGANGAAVCVDCEAGTYSAATAAQACVLCPAFSTSTPASLVVLNCRCAPGATGADGKACAQCAAGKHKAVVGDSACVECGPGSYAAAGASACALCAAGAFSAAAGAVTAETCEACEAGRFSAVEGATSESTCEACPSDTFSSALGAVSGDTCQACAAKSGSPEASSSVLECVCNAGHTGPDGGGCGACVPGTYKDAPGAADCAACGAGFYSEEIGRASCRERV